MAENEVKEKDMMNGKLTEANATNQDNDFKYYMQDTSKIYIGARHTYAELMDHEMVPFKL